MKTVKNAFTGIIVGIIFIIVGTVLLIFNEGNNVKNIKTVAEARDALVNVEATPVKPENEGALVGVSGTLSYTDEVLLDYEFQVSSLSKTYKMERVVEMYQWKEESDTSDDKTTYSYKKVWSSDLINSSSFKESGHGNPNTIPYENVVLYADNVHLGDYTILKDSLAKVKTDKEVQIQNPSLPTGYSVQSNYITSSSNINNPEIGDVRIKYTLVSSNEFSIVAMQSGNTLVDYKSNQNKVIHLASMGIVSGEHLIDKLEASNNTLKWILRVLGILLICFGFVSLLSPVTQMLNIIPLVGKSISGIVTLMGFMAGFGYAFIVIAVAWIAYRPLLGIGLLIAAGGLITALVCLIKKYKKKTPEASEVVQNNVVNQMPPTDNQVEIPNEPLNQRGIINQLGESVAPVLPSEQMPQMMNQPPQEIQQSPAVGVTPNNEQREVMVNQSGMQQPINQDNANINTNNNNFQG